MTPKRNNLLPLIMATAVLISCGCSTPDRVRTAEVSRNELISFQVHPDISKLYPYHQVVGVGDVIINGDFELAAKGWEVLCKEKNSPYSACSLQLTFDEGEVAKGKSAAVLHGKGEGKSEITLSQIVRIPESSFLQFQWKTNGSRKEGKMVVTLSRADDKGEVVLCVLRGGADIPTGLWEQKGVTLSLLEPNVEYLLKFCVVDYAGSSIKFFVDDICLGKLIKPDGSSVF